MSYPVETKRYVIKPYGPWWQAIVDKNTDLFVRDNTNRLCLFLSVEQAETYIATKLSNKA